MIDENPRSRAAREAAERALVLECFGNELSVMRSSIDELAANFVTPDSQGSTAYQKQMMVDHPDLDAATLRADAVVNVNAFINALKRPHSN